MANQKTIEAYDATLMQILRDASQLDDVLRSHEQPEHVKLYLAGVFMARLKQTLVDAGVTKWG